MNGDYDSSELPLGNMSTLSLVLAYLGYSYALTVMLNGLSSEEQVQRLMMALTASEAARRAAEAALRAAEERAENAESRIECQVCMVARCDNALEPCMHLCLCEECSTDMDYCPQCRREVEGTRRVYLP